MTQALTYGVYGRPGLEERRILTLADNFRAALCSLYQQEHDAGVRLRDELFPRVLPAMAAHEAAKYRVSQIEREIKEYHSEVRERNAVTAEQRERLIAAKKIVAATQVARKAAQTEWFIFLRTFRAAYHCRANWKDVKAIERRRELYASMDWAGLLAAAESVAKKEDAAKYDWRVDPTKLARYAEIMFPIDIAQRELFAEYQALGLHSAIRGEIVAASEPKLSRTGPGMRYFFGREPQPQPWRKLVLQFAGGLTVGQALAATTGPLRLREQPEKRTPRKTYFRVTQNIGNASHEEWLEYNLVCHVPLTPELTIQRWALVIDGNKRYAVPTIAQWQPDRPTGTGSFSVRIGWARTANGGLKVAEFLGAHVRESLILPPWWVDDMLAEQMIQQEIDAAANDLLAELGEPVNAKTLQGLAALDAYVAANPTATAAGNQADKWHAESARSVRRAAKLRRCRDKIYETVARRICSRHAAIVGQPLDLAKIARYDTRDLLAQDALPQVARMQRQLASPGKLTARLWGWGLASSDVADEPPGDARNTDVFTTYIDSLRQKTGRRNDVQHSRSRNVAGAVARQ